MDKNALLRNFSLNLPVDYHGEALERLAGIDTKGLRKAAVLIGCVERENELHVILTRRAKHLKHHPGQISFPGGKVEPSDLSLAHTAMRETEEEIGISRNQLSIIGQLPELMTISNFMITPILALVSPDYTLIIDKNEVDEIFEVPASHLFDIQQLYSQTFQFEYYSHRVFAIPYKDYFIWGVTAQIIQALQLQLRDL